MLYTIFTNRDKYVVDILKPITYDVDSCQHNYNDIIFANFDINLIKDTYAIIIENYNGLNLLIKPSKIELQDNNCVISVENIDVLPF